MKVLFSRRNRLFIPMLALVNSLFFQACSDNSELAASEGPGVPSSLKSAHILAFTQDHGLSPEALATARTALETLARKQGFTLVVAEDGSILTDAELRRFNAVVFLSVPESSLDEQQQIALERYIQAGGGFVRLGTKTDESLSARDYDGGSVRLITSDNPVENFSDQGFIESIQHGLLQAVSINFRDNTTPSLNYSRSRPESNRFIKKPLLEGLNEPVKFDFFPNGDVLIALRPGELVRFENKTGEVFPAGKLDVAYHKFQEWGLIGVALDPGFSRNRWVYLAYNAKDGAGAFIQRLSRFQWLNNQIDAGSEQQLLEYLIDDNCCHTGGDLYFGNNGELFFSTGDNTNPHDQDGYAPVDFRPDHQKNDGLRAPGSTQDLRGKILRIKPLADGGYDIPEGNLFSDPSQGRPEIYVMGAQNPYSISFDHKTNTLFYGDIGPDAGADSELKGPQGYDEINRVTAPGNFGWPLVAGVYRSENYPHAPNRYPTYYDNKLFIADFMRAWVKVVSFDEQGTIQKIEPFAQQINYALPIAARFSPEGTLYVLEYGSSWFTHNPDSRLVRIEYVGAGNRPPIAEISLDKTRAGLPAQLHASAEKSRDLDGDQISFHWTLACIVPTCAELDLGSGSEVSPRMTRAGVYKLTLAVTDSQGAMTKTEQELRIGNEPATINLQSDQNKSFYWGDTRELSYAVTIVDQEDGVITHSVNQNPLLQWTSFLSASADNQGHQQANLAEQALSIMDANNCLACHKVDEKSVGPAWRDIAAKYSGDSKAVNRLTHKIANGGSGVWGAMNMPAFLGLSEADRQILVSHIFSLGEEKQDVSLPLVGKLALDEHADLVESLADNKPLSSTPPTYVLNVTYADKPVNGMDSISIHREFRILPHRFSLDAVFNDDAVRSDIKRSSYNGIKVIQFLPSQKWRGFYLGHFDLSHIKNIKLGAVLYREATDWLVEIRRDNADGEVIASGLISSNEIGSYSRSAIGINSGKREAPLYIQFKPGKSAETELALLDISFEK